MNDKFTLREIANWQLKTKKTEVKLPSVQRSFVWKSHQVENLWDSILRGYPIGSFLLQKTGNTYDLMDGQQRASSIFLGFFNPYTKINETKAWSIKGELPVVWIDICPKEKPEASKFLIRLTTRSHPWGYRAKENYEKLSVSDRRKALEIFRKNPKNEECGYTSFKNTTTFPYDASFPLPLAFFIESDTVEEIIMMAKKYLPVYFCTKDGEFENKQKFIELLKTELKEYTNEIFNFVKNNINREINYDIVDDEMLQAEETQEEPTLFIRINSAGTPLKGDDLIYSIYKTVFKESKDLVENVGIGFITPTQIISLVSRMAWFELNEYEYPPKMKIRDFQKNIKNEDFKNKLCELIGTNDISEVKKIFESAIDILKCKDNALFKGEIPPVLIKEFIRKSPDLFLFFICWLRLHNFPRTKTLQLKIVAKLLSFSWFSFGNVPRLWDEINDKDFWNKPLNQYMWWDDADGIGFLLPPDLLKQYYSQKIIEKIFLEQDSEKHQLRWNLWRKGVGEQIKFYYNQTKSQNFKQLDRPNEYFNDFINSIKSNKSLILFAQRNYINTEFHDYNQMEGLEDTNVPWDWDHIYPEEWVYNMKKCPQIIRDWNGTNGNFRALTLEQNRSEGNGTSPKKRLNKKKIRQNSFVNDDDWIYWQKIEDKIQDNKSINHFRAIITRMINIYEKFWNDLKINDLIEQ